MASTLMTNPGSEIWMKMFELKAELRVGHKNRNVLIRETLGEIMMTIDRVVFDSSGQEPW